MMFYEFNVGNKEYKLRLTTRNIVSLEKQLGCNPLGIFGNGDTLPTITQMVAVLHASLQSMHHGIDMNAAFDIFDDFLAEGNNMTDFLPVIVGVYKVSGLIGKDKEVSTEKN